MRPFTIMYGRREMNISYVLRSWLNGISTEMNIGNLAAELEEEEMILKQEKERAK